MTDTTLTSAGPARTGVADRWMRRVLFLTGDPSPSGAAGQAGRAQSAVRTSILVSTVRCLLMYIVLPFVLPALGWARGVSAGVGVALGVVAVVSLIAGVRRFWACDHPRRWWFTGFGAFVLPFLVSLLVADAARL